jgi:lipoate-protein ligase A
VVAHGEDVTYTLIVPTVHAFARLPAPESYRRIHGCLAEVLRGAGVETTLAGATAEKVSTACFENPAEADVLAGEQKVAGAAQRRTRWGLLHQGSIQTHAGDIAPRLAASFADEIVLRPLGGDEVAAASRLALEKYASDSWLRRF